MEVPLHIGLDKTNVDSILLIWPDNRYEKLSAIKDSIISLNYKPGLPKFDYSIIARHNYNPVSVTDITSETDLLFLHEENPFNEFDRNR
jgi:hypothetical protein